jgi:HEAT repeat protein
MDDDLRSLLAELICGDDERAERAAIQLADHEDAVPALVSLAESESIDARWWAARTLAQFPQARSILCSALADESVEVRQAAALALSHQPDPDSVPALVSALSDHDSLVSTLAANALILIGKDAIPALLEVLQHGEYSAKVSAARAVAEIKDHRAIQALMNILQEDSLLMQFWAEQGLDKLGLGMIYMKPE